MSDSKVYKIRVNGAEYGADDKASAEALAELLGGEVFTTSRKEALAHVRTITAKPDFPPVLNDMLSMIKETVIDEVTAHSLMTESVWRVTVQYDSKRESWYSEVKNLASGPEVYNQTTGEKYDSVCHARWSYSRSCAVKYLANGIFKDDKFSKNKPEVILNAEAKAKATANAVAEAAEDTIPVLMESGMSEEEARASLPI